MYFSIGKLLHRNNTFCLIFFQVSNLKPVTCTGWTRGALVALVAAVTILGALWRA